MMRRLGLLAVASAILGCGGGAGDRDGRCAPSIPGDYRCIGNKVEACEVMDNPAKNPPEWVILEDCSALSGASVPARARACTVLSDGSTACR